MKRGRGMSFRGPAAFCRAGLLNPRVGQGEGEGAAFAPGGFSRQAAAML